MLYARGESLRAAGLLDGAVGELLVLSDGAVGLLLGVCLCLICDDQVVTVPRARCGQPHF
jgi:hypothetical protein